MAKAYRELTENDERRRRLAIVEEGGHGREIGALGRRRAVVARAFNGSVKNRCRPCTAR